VTTTTQLQHSYNTQQLLKCIDGKNIIRTSLSRPRKRHLIADDVSVRRSVLSRALSIHIAPSPHLATASASRIRCNQGQRPRSMQHFLHLAHTPDRQKPTPSITLAIVTSPGALCEGAPSHRPAGGSLSLLCLLRSEGPTPRLGQP
jgi:hypothetical protein